MIGEVVENGVAGEIFAGHTLAIEENVFKGHTDAVYGPAFFSRRPTYCYRQLGPYGTGVECG
ncbi:MAG TPA: hypothetical protein VI685_19540 [Candidatus Angelobacter sp.]